MKECLLHYKNRLQQYDLMKRKIIIIVSGVVVLSIIALALSPLSKKEPALSFETVKAEKGTITNTVTATGTIQAIRTVDVGTQVSGIILHVYADFNDNVRQGQLLARLDETPLITQLEQSQAQLDQAQAQLNFQESTYKRLKILFDKNLVAQSDYDQALYNFENSRASLSNARSALSRAKVNLGYATIYSPIDGVVLNRAVEEGQTVAASFNTPTLFKIANDLTRMEVQTSVDEADIGKVKEGQRVEFTVDAYPDMSFGGTVSQVRLQPVTTNNVVTYTVVLSAPNPDKKLMPGMTASTTIFVDEKHDVIIVPGKAVRFSPDPEILKKSARKMKPSSGSDPGMLPPAETARQGNSITYISSLARPANDTTNLASERTVWVRDDRALIRPLRITAGIDNGTSIEVVSGLGEGDEVIVSIDDGDEKAASTGPDNGPPGPFPF